MAATPIDVDVTTRLRQKSQAVLQDPTIMEVVCKSAQGGERHGVQEDREK
jgi:hypothetical protein